VFDGAVEAEDFGVHGFSESASQRVSGDSGPS
jgi:hypothetical protein